MIEDSVEVQTFNFNLKGSENDCIKCLGIIDIFTNSLIFRGSKLIKPISFNMILNIRLVGTGVISGRAGDHVCCMAVV